MRTWYAMWLSRIDEAIATAEQQEQEKRRGEEARPPTPDWVTELGIGVGSRPIEVHVGGCYPAGKRRRAITREQAEQPRGWKPPTESPGEGWQVPVVEVLAPTFDRYDVVGFYADPAKWKSHVADWEAAYGPRLLVQSTRNHPIEWWMTGGRSTLIVRALEKFHTALTERELTIDGSPALVRHLLNSRRRKTRTGIQIMKENPDSPNKIDAAIAAVLAWQCRLDAVAAGLAVEAEEMGGCTF
ncbi:DUF6233 domain-containing protein [Streptomyces sp. NPDC005148]